MLSAAEIQRWRRVLHTIWLKFIRKWNRRSPEMKRWTSLHCWVRGETCSKQVKSDNTFLHNLRLTIARRSEVLGKSGLSLSQQWQLHEAALVDCSDVHVPGRLQHVTSSHGKAEFQDSEQCTSRLACFAFSSNRWDCRWCDDGTMIDDVRFFEPFESVKIYATAISFVFEVIKIDLHWSQWRTPHSHESKQNTRRLSNSTFFLCAEAMFWWTSLIVLGTRFEADKPGRDNLLRFFSIES